MLRTQPDFRGAAASDWLQDDPVDGGGAQAGRASITAAEPSLIVTTDLNGLMIHTPSVRVSVPSRYNGAVEVVPRPRCSIPASPATVSFRVKPQYRFGPTPALLGPRWCQMGYRGFQVQRSPPPGPWLGLRKETTMKKCPSFGVL